MNFTKKTILTLFGSLLLWLSSVQAAGIDHFEVKLSPENSKVGEALDLEIEAVDKNNNIIDDYNGTILIFSESDPEAELPSALEENTYTFSASDQWKIKFENAVKFKAKWNQDIYIYDLNDDTVLWIWEAVIEEDEKETLLDIEILSPESWLTIPNNTINLSGTSKKNHTIKLIINGTTELLVTTNNQWLFEKTIEDLQNGENTFRAQVLNSDEEVVWESDEVKISVESNLPRLKNIKTTPEQIEAENSFDIEIITTEGLSEVNVIMNETLTKLQKDERDEALWKKSIYAPADAGNYQIDVILKDEIWHEVKEVWASSIIVTAVELKAAELVEWEEFTPNENTETDKKEETESSEDSNKKDLKITGIKVVELKSKSIVTWDEVDGAESYNVYKKEKNEKLELIWNTNTPEFEIEFGGDKIKYDYFSIKAVWRIDDGSDTGEIYEWSLSDATKVQTGPEVLLLFILALFVWWIVFVFNKRKA